MTSKRYPNLPTDVPDRGAAWRNMPRRCLYGTTDGDLQTIAQRSGLVCNSPGGFMRRRFPEQLARHKGKAAGPKG